VRFTVSSDEHYTRTFTAARSDEISDYVVPFVEQTKLDGTPVTAEEFKQYCSDFNFTYRVQGMKSYFPNENKEIWIASTHPQGLGYTFDHEQIADIKELVEKEIFPFIDDENEPAFVLDDPDNPYSTDEIPYEQPGKIVIFPNDAGYAFSTNINNEGVIVYGLAGLDENMDMGDLSQPPANDLQERAREATLEEVASCMAGPRDNQGAPYGGHGIMTIFVNGGEMYPVDQLLFDMAQKYQPKEQLDDVLGN
jgi:hypothetical protein